LKFHSIKSSLFNGSSYLYKGSLSALKTDSSKPSPSSTSSIKNGNGEGSVSGAYFAGSNASHPGWGILCIQYEMYLGLQ
jgi:hypothetical protein